MNDLHLPIGTHAIADILSTHLSDIDDLTNTLNLCCELGGATVLKTIAYPFEPQGATIVCILAESHAVISTYPEHDTAMIDVFTCGNDIDPVVILHHIVDRLEGDILNEWRLKRGHAI